MSCGNLDPFGEKSGRFLKRKFRLLDPITKSCPVITKISLHMFRPPGFIASKKISVKICKIFLTDEKVQNIRLFNLSPPSVFFTPIFCARTPGGLGGVVFESTSYLNRKNVNYCTMKVVKIGSNFNGEKVVY